MVLMIGYNVNRIRSLNSTGARRYMYVSTLDRAVSIGSRTLTWAPDRYCTRRRSYYYYYSFWSVCVSIWFVGVVFILSIVSYIQHI